VKILEAYHHCYKTLKCSGEPVLVNSQQTLDLYNQSLIRDESNDYLFKKLNTYLTLCHNNSKYNGVVLHQKQVTGLLTFGLLQDKTILYGRVIEPLNKNAMIKQIKKLDENNQLTEETLRKKPRIAEFLMNALQKNSLQVKFSLTNQEYWQESIKNDEGLRNKNELITLGKLLLSK